MNVSNQNPREPKITKRRLRLSVVWLIPAMAVVIGLWMALNAWSMNGPEITIRFHTAAGLTAGKTLVKYKDVIVGTVASVDLADDGSGVLAKVALSSHAKSLATSGTRFWVVRPRLGLGGLSGVDTLLSGSYIAADKGVSLQPASAFIGLESPPTVTNGTPGSTFVLHADDLGSLDVNSPVYYRHIQVGRIASYELDDDGKGITLLIFVDAPYDRFVTADTRFWNASGVDIALGATGIKVSTQSLATLIAGGIAFANEAGSDDEARRPRPARFPLAKDQQRAMDPLQGPSLRFKLRFAESLHGLSAGAPVYFSGVEVGSVASVSLGYDAANHHFPTIVMIDVYPARMGNVLQTLPKTKGTIDEQAARFLGVLVKDGLRAQARAGNLLTGQLNVSLDFVPHATQTKFNPAQRPLQIPTVPGGFDRIEDQVASIVGKLDKMPLDQIGEQMNTSLVNFNRAMAQVNDQVLPQTTQALAQAQSMFAQTQHMVSSDAPLQQSIMQTLNEVSESARSLRTLTDLLGRHPEAVLLGLKRSPEASSSSVEPGPLTSGSAK